MITDVWVLEEGSTDLKQKASYSLPPKKAMVAYIKQFLENNFNTWEYPEFIKGMRESQTVPDHWYFDVFPWDYGKNAVVCAYPRR